MHVDSCARRRRRPYFGLGAEGEEDVGQERLRPHGAVEGDHAGQEGPEHHQDVEVAAPAPPQKKKKEEREKKNTAPRSAEVTGDR